MWQDPEQVEGLELNQIKRDMQKQLSLLFKQSEVSEPKYGRLDCKDQGVVGVWGDGKQTWKGTARSREVVKGNQIKAYY